MGLAARDYLYDGINPVQEDLGSGQKANLLTGLGVDERFVRTDPVWSQHFLPDALGGTVALTDGAGTVATEYTYEPFGATTETGATSGNTFQYTGRENDGSGLYYYRARYYSPTFQRFISEDPIEFLAGDMNLYAYVGNNPISFVDSLGLRIQWGNLVIRNPQVRSNLKKLNQEIVNLGIADTDFLLRITGGDRYVDSAGNIRSATNDQIVPDTFPKSPHVDKMGARAVDLAVTGVSDDVFDRALEETEFYPNETRRDYDDGHTHISS